MTRKQIAREIDFVDSVMQSHFNDYGEDTHRALQEAIKLVEQEPKNKDLIKHIEAVKEALNNMVDGLNDDTDYYNATYHLEQIKKEVEQ